MQPHDILISILLLLLIAVVVSVAVRRIKLPYSIGLVLAGLVLGYWRLFPSFSIDPDLIIYVVLPALLFDSAFASSISNLKEHWPVIFSLAVPGTIVSIAVVGVIVHYLVGIPWMSSLLFASLIVPTDTISILSVFKELRPPAKLSTLVEGESLFNDGTAIIIFKLILSLILAEQYRPQEIEYFRFSAELIVSYVGGLALGLAAGYAAGLVMKRLRDHLIEILLTVIAIYGVFLLGESIGVSAIIAVVAASLMIGNFGKRMELSATTHIALTSFWNFTAFTLNSVVFLVIGLQLNFDLLLDNLLPILISVLAVNLGRIAFIYPFSQLVNRIRGRRRMETPEIPLRWQHVLVLGNLKGSLSMALAVSLPATLIYRDYLIILTFGVVFFSLIVQGTTLRPILRLLNLQTISTGQIEFDKRQGMMMSARAALAALDGEYRKGTITSAVYNDLKEQYEFIIQNTEKSLQKLQSADPALAESHLQTVYRQMLMLQRSVILNARLEHVISEDAASQLIEVFDNQIATLSWLREDDAI
jgi:CPA1 family monovalent cation:H+ antiporter